MKKVLMNLKFFSPKCFSPTIFNTVLSPCLSLALSPSLLSKGSLSWCGSGKGAGRRQTILSTTGERCWALPLHPMATGASDIMSRTSESCPVDHLFSLSLCFLLPGIRGTVWKCTWAHLSTLQLPALTNSNPNRAAHPQQGGAFPYCTR